MTYRITPREDCSRHYDILEYDDHVIGPLLILAALKGDVFNDIIYVDRRVFGRLMAKQDWKAIELGSRRSQKYVKKYVKQEA